MMLDAIIIRQDMLSIQIMRRTRFWHLKEAYATGNASIEWTNAFKLKLFIVNEEFTLGANRDEPGQRANEFIRKAKLTKPFYAGLYEITNEEFQKFKKGETNYVKAQ